MDRLDEFRLGSDAEPPPGQEPDRGVRTPLWSAAALLVVAAAVAAVVLFKRPSMFLFFLWRISILRARSANSEQGSRPSWR